MSKRITVEVTQEDIDLARTTYIINDTGAMWRCPIERAIDRIATPYKYAVSSTQVYAMDEAIATYLSDKAQRWVKAFDFEKPVQPTRLQVTLP